MPNTVYRHPLIELCIQEMWFAQEMSLGIKFRRFFNDDAGALPLPVVALVVTAVRAQVCLVLVASDGNHHRYSMRLMSGNQVFALVAVSVSSLPTRNMQEFTRSNWPVCAAGKSVPQAEATLR